MLDFWLTCISQAVLFGMSGFAFYGWVRPRSKGGITRRVRAMGVRLSKQPKITQRAVAFAFFGIPLSLFGFTVYSQYIHLVKHGDPEKTQAASNAGSLAVSIKKALRDNQTPESMQREFVKDLNDLIPQLFSHGFWSTQLHHFYSDGVTLQSRDEWTNLQQTLETIKKEHD